MSSDRPFLLNKQFLFILQLERLSPRWENKNSKSSLLIYDVRDYSNPVYVQSFYPFELGEDLMNPLADFFLDSKYLYIVQNASTLDIYNYTVTSSGNPDPFSFELLSRTECFVCYRTIFVDNNISYIGGNNDLVIFNVSDRNNPVFMANIATGGSGVYDGGGDIEAGFIRKIILSNDSNTLFLIEYGLGLVRFNVTNPTNPQKTGLVGLKLASNMFMGKGNDFIYVSVGMDGMKIVNLSAIVEDSIDLNQDAIVSSFDAFFATDVAVSDDENMAYLYDGIEVKIIDVSDKHHPKLIAKGQFESTLIFEDSGIFSLMIIDINHGFFMTANHGFYIVEWMPRIHGTSSHSYCCDEITIEVEAHDDTGSIVVEFNVSRADYCNGWGICLADYKCSCFGAFTGDNCESWDCEGIDFKSTSSVCNGRGSCVSHYEFESNPSIQCRKTYHPK